MRGAMCAVDLRVELSAYNQLKIASVRLKHYR